MTGDLYADDAVPEAAEDLLHGRRETLERYAALLAGPGIERGLLGPSEGGRLWSRHLLNCAAVAPLIPPGDQVADVGSGAGLPGLVLAVVRPDLQITLVEPMARRVAFLQECVDELGLPQVTVTRARAEELAGILLVGTVTARAVAPLLRLAPATLPLLVPRGQLLALKGRSAADELAQARPLLAGWGVEEAEMVECGGEALAEPTRVIRLRLDEHGPRRATAPHRDRRTNTRGRRRPG